MAKRWTLSSVHDCATPLRSSTNTERSDTKPDPVKGQQKLAGFVPLRTGPCLWRQIT